MANDRLGFKCKECGVIKWIAKCMGDRLFYVQPVFEENIRDELNEFFSKHHFCERSTAERPFEMIYESEL